MCESIPITFYSLRSPTICVVPSPSAPADCLTVILSYPSLSLLRAPYHCLRLSLNHAFFYSFLSCLST